MNAADLSIIETHRKPQTTGDEHPAALTIFQRLNKGDKTAVADALSTYGDSVWTFAVKCTGSARESEMLSREIFQDIWEYAAANGTASEPEPARIRLIAVRRLYKHKWQHRRDVL